MNNNNNNQNSDSMRKNIDLNYNQTINSNDVLDKVKKYFNIIKKSNIVFLIITILCAGFSFYLMNSTEEAVLPFLEAVFFIVFELVILFNGKTIHKSTGILALVLGIFMVVCIFGISLFDFIYMIMGIVYVINSITFLTNLKKAKTIVPDHELINNNTKDTKLKYLTIIPNVLFLPLLLIYILADQGPATIPILIISILIFLFNFIFCVILMRNHKKVLIYISLVFSVLFLIINTILLVDIVGQNIYDKKETAYRDTQQYLNDLCEKTETKLENDVVFLPSLVVLNVPINQDSNVFLKKVFESDVLKYSYDSFKELEDKGYTCDGYVTLKWKPNVDINSYQDVKYTDFYSHSMADYFDENKAYIKCDGKYSYTTPGFDESILNQ